MTMSAVVTLNVPANGVGTPSDVSAFGADKTFVGDGTMLPGEMLVVEASEDPTGTLEADRTYNGVLTIDSNFPGKVTVQVVANTMRVQRYFPMGTSPSLTITGASGIQNFGDLNVPTITAPSGGVADGTPFDVSAFGGILSVAIGGTFIDGESVLIMGSLDNIIYDGIFAVNNGYPGVTTFRANYNWLKVRRSGRPNPNTIKVGVGGSTESGGGTPGVGILNFDSIAVVGNMLASFNTSGYPKGTLAYVGNDTFVGQSSVQRYYTLAYGEGLTADGIAVVNSPTFGADGAQWKSMDTVNQGWLQVDAWYISNVGNDENTGTTTLAPIKTMREANRRQAGQLIQTGRTVVWHQQDNMDVASFAIMTNVKCEPGGHATWRGDLTNPISAAGAITWSNRTNTDEYTIGKAGVGLLPTCILINDTSSSVSVLNGYVGGEVPNDNAATVNQPRTINLNTGALGATQLWADGDIVAAFTPYDLPSFPWPASGRGYVVSLVNFAPDPGSGQETCALPDNANIVACLNSMAMTWIGGNDIEWGECGFQIDHTFIHGSHTFAGCSNVGGFITFENGCDVSLIDYFSVHQTGVISLIASSVRAIGVSVFGVFDTATAAITASSSGQYLGPNATIYGGNNTDVWLNAAQGCQCDSGTIVGTTTSVTPLIVSGVSYALAARPIVDAPTFAGIR